MSSVLDASSSSSSACLFAQTRPFLVFSTSSAAPPVAGLPLRDGAGEQRRGLHEEELPRDARLYEALQPAYHPGGRAHVEVRHVRKKKKKKLRKSAGIQVTAEAVCGRSRSSALFFSCPPHTPHPPLNPSHPAHTVHNNSID